MEMLQNDFTTCKATLGNFIAKRDIWMKVLKKNVDPAQSGMDGHLIRSE